MKIDDIPKITQDYIESLPEFRGGKIIECSKLDEMEDHYEIISPTTTKSQQWEQSALVKWVSDMKKKKIPYVLTAEQLKNCVRFRLWVSGVEAREGNYDCYRSHNLNDMTRSMHE